MQNFEIMVLYVVGALLVSAAPGSAELEQRQFRPVYGVTTWSGDNCRGSSANPAVWGSGSKCFNNLPGGSFSTNRPNGDCGITTWSGTNCRGSSANFNGDNPSGCIPVPFGSVELWCN